jgi:hypothetical protein
MKMYGTKLQFRTPAYWTFSENENYDAGLSSLIVTVDLVMDAYSTPDYCEDISDCQYTYDLKYTTWVTEIFPKVSLAKDGSRVEFSIVPFDSSKVEVSEDDPVLIESIMVIT